MKLSIVIPVYNKAQYVVRCLEDLLRQEFDDFEVVCVDDGSTDDSGRLCDEVAVADPRVRVYHQPNGGVTAARRLGVEHSTGRYVMFVDADDRLLPGALETMYSAMETSGADEVIATYRTHTGVDSPIVYTGLTPVEPLVRAIVTGKSRFPVLWAVIFRRDILEGTLQTPRDIVEGEDRLMQLQILMKQPRVFFIPNQVYLYTADLPNDRRRTLQREQHYDNLLRQTLRLRWEDYAEAFTLHQLKEYETFVARDEATPPVLAYYRSEIKSLPASIPFYDRLVWWLPVWMSRPLIRLYKKLIMLKLHDELPPPN